MSFPNAFNTLQVIGVENKPSHNDIFTPSTDATHLESVTAKSAFAKNYLFKSMKQIKKFLFFVSNSAQNISLALFCGTMPFVFYDVDKTWFFVI